MFQQPFISICTPTFNRRPFIPMMLKCFDHQTYPKDRMEWIIIDDGTDKIEDLVSHIPQVKYYKYDEKMTLGKKRNLMHEKTSGDIIVYMDDDDYYPPERVSHAVTKLLENPHVLVAGSSKMHIYFKHINKMYSFGPYGANHATAATFAFRRELLTNTKYEEVSLSEEKKFLKDYTIPMVQLDSEKTILVFSHIHNSADKKQLLDQGPNQFVKETTYKVKDMVKDESTYTFFMHDIDDLLANYSFGHPKNKPDVDEEIKKREKENNMIVIENMKTQLGKYYLDALIQKNKILELTNENSALKEKVKYLEEKIKEVINKKISQVKNNIKTSIGDI
jgi:glycosyltransferase involved in cell wall biosynthesis